MTVSQTTRFGLYTWSEDTDPFTRSQMLTSHENIEERAARFLSGTVLPSGAAQYARTFFYKTDNQKLYYYNAEDGTGSWVEVTLDLLSVNTVNAKGDILVGTADNVVSVRSVGSNEQVLMADSAESTGMKWTKTLPGYTLTSPTISTPTITTPLLSHPRETWTITSATPTGTLNIDVATDTNWYYTTNAAANWVFNIRGNSTTSLNTWLPDTASVTVALAVTQGGTAYRPYSATFTSGLTIDGTHITGSNIRWQGGVAPTIGNASGIDIYVYTIIKRSANTYQVLASQTRFA